MLYAAIDVLVFGATTAAGLLCPWGVARYYLALVFAFVGIATPTLLGATLTTLASERSATRIQGPRRRPALILRALRDTLVAAWMAAALGAWALSRAWAGLPIGLVWTVPSSKEMVLLALGVLGGLMVLDAWLYWKHRLLHTRALFPFHRLHHVYRDPTAFTSFAVGPVESLLTFWPVLLVALPAAAHFAPVYWTLVVGFITLNLYLHCGATIPLVERLLTPLTINTSAFHNVHHANAEAHFGEALSLWDHLCGTTLEGRARRSPKAVGTAATSNAA
jgi:lathosterol oxidase